MKIHIKVRPRSRKSGVESQADGSFVVRLSATPVDGKANEQLIELLPEYFGVAKSLVRIVRGKTSRLKTVEIIGKD